MFYERSGIVADADANFAATLDRHGRLLKSYARRLTGNSIDADDLVQETMLRCWSSRHRFKPDTNFGAWSRVVMRNSFLSSHRRDRFHANLAEEAFDHISGAEGGQDLAVQVNDVGRALDQLSPDHRDAVMLVAKGVSNAVAAAQLSISESAFKSRVTRARVHLHALINDPNAEPYRAPAAKITPVRKARDWKNVMIG